jgi:ribosome-associated protein
VALIRINEAISIDERDLEERFIRASGPGGQNVNKLATAVQLRFDVSGASNLP